MYFHVQSSVCAIHAPMRHFRWVHPIDNPPSIINSLICAPAMERVVLVPLQGSNVAVSRRKEGPQNRAMCGIRSVWWGIKKPNSGRSADGGARADQPHHKSQEACRGGGRARKAAVIAEVSCVLKHEDLSEGQQNTCLGSKMCSQPETVYGKEARECTLQDPPSCKKATSMAQISTKGMSSTKHVSEKSVKLLLFRWGLKKVPGCSSYPKP